MGIGVSTNTNTNSVNMMNSIQNSCEMASKNTNQIDRIKVRGWGNKLDVKQKIVSVSKCKFQSNSQFDENSSQNTAAETKANLGGIAVNTNANNIKKTITNMTNTKCSGFTLNKNKIGEIDVGGTFNKVGISQNINSETECGSVAIFKGLSKTDQKIKSKTSAGLDLGKILIIILVAVVVIVALVVILITNKNTAKTVRSVGKTAKDIKSPMGGGGNIIQKIIYDLSQ